jgi:nitrogen fixation protein FixH
MKRAFTGRHMAAAMLIFFGVIIAVNLGMATLAARSWTGLLVKNAYVESQRFNERIAATEARDLKGWAARLSAAPDRIRYRLLDSNGQLLDVERVIVSISRPTHETEDQSIVLTPDGRGGFSGAALPGPGAWHAEVEARLADGSRDTRLFRLHSTVD